MNIKIDYEDGIASINKSIQGLPETLQEKETVRKDKSGNYYVSVRGGKMTGFKWGPVSDGHIARDGTTFVQGDHFMQRAVSASAGDVDRMIDAMIKEIVDD